MKKWKSSKNKSKKKSNSPEEEDEDKKDMPKEVGLYHDFLVFEKNEKFNNKLEFKDCIFDDPNIKDWLILQYSPNKTKSRFSSLFEEIIENDKKLVLEEKSEKNDNIKPENKTDNINNNNIINNGNNIININNDNNKNFQINNINNDNDINSIKINDAQNDNIMINNNNAINFINEQDNINNMNINNINEINNNRNNSVSLTNPNILEPNIAYNNFIQDKKPPELSFSYSQKGNLPLIGPHSFEDKKSITSSYSGPHEHKKSIYSNYSGPHEHKKSIYSNYSGPHEHKKSIYSNYSGPHDHKKSIYSNSSGNYGVSTNESEYNYSYYSNRSNFSSFERNSSFSEKKFESNVDIKKVIFLEDRRATVMIKNIPNKFTRDMLLAIIDQNFKYAYDLFILPTDVNGYKNFGYAFINFTCSYYIPYFYFLFNGKRWNSTNSQKICEITYSKVQGRNNLLNHYINKIIFRNEEVKKHNMDTKFIIPNEYRNIFNKAFPNNSVEEYKYYFITKMPFKY